VAKRYELDVILVSNSEMQVPDEDWVELIVVDKRFDAADDWIVEHVAPNDIVITGDIPLASRCVKEGARAISPKGRVFTEDSIGETLATRDLMAGLREQGMMTGGPPPFEKKDRSRFLHQLDEIIQAVRRGR
jgi:uncharacterized protein YaiI (UPF0178 family)